MKKFFIILSLLAVVFVAGCVEFSGQQATLTNPQLMQETQDLVLQTEFYPEEAKIGKTINFGVLIEAKKNIMNVNIDIYDTCLFSVDKNKDTIALLRANTTKVWRFKFTALQTDFERDCNIRFKVSYDANASVTQDVVVLSDSEYMERQRAGTLSDFDISIFKTESPLDLAISFSELQPFQTGTDIYMNIDYANAGAGFLDKVEKNNILITLPSNVMIEDKFDWEKNCNDFGKTTDNKIGALNKDKIFINNKAPASTCKFTTTTKTKTGTVRAIAAERITVSAKYKYELDNYITVKIKPK